jgi:hypothetical protein
VIGATVYFVRSVGAVFAFAFADIVTSAITVIGFMTRFEFVVAQVCEGAT